MAQVDVSELLSDPTFIDPITVVTRVPTINAFGENTLVDTPLVTIGSVQPASGREIQRLANALQVGNISSFWYKGVIEANVPMHYPSVVEFKGNRYQVLNVLDWSNWGAGWTQGLCVQEDLS